ncbi:MAG: hypothetical protein VB080_14120 [Propionicimonas sp.]|uniref:hypothetical protein n=1 Tax=Propionicimonas sp. TaxID=1955623 RepID=UPI002B20E6C4|nr:hypothetical protein [Propionicimonas sp.]MEA4945559.1 hypothetical protein [Propionicimonas sp.]
MMVDQVTMSLVTAVVVIVAGVLFLIETIVHQASPAARIWTAAFLAGILTSFCYLVWALDVPGAWVATSIGNAAFVLSMGSLWLGCRRFNEHPVRLSGIVVGAAVAATALAALLAGPGGGDWAGAAVMFWSIGILAALGTVESRRGVLGKQSLAAAITVVLGLAAVYYLARAVVFLAAGPGSVLFERWFDTANTSILTIVLTVAAVVAMSVLRATESTLRGRGGTTTLDVDADGLLDARSFAVVLASAVARSERAGDRLAVIALRMDELPQITTAFGAHEASELLKAWRTSLLHGAPPLGLVGEEGPAGLMLAVPVTSASDARSLAVRLQQRVIDEVGSIGATVTPVIGVGVAVTDVVGYAASALIDVSNEAARHSAESPDAAVVLAS